MKRSTMIVALVLALSVILFIHFKYSGNSKAPPPRAALAMVGEPKLAETPPESGSVGNEMLLALPQKRRAAILSAIIVGADEQCVAARTFYMGTSSQDRSAFWSVGCTNGRAYVVQIQADAVGSTTVLDCSMLKFVAGVDCFKRFVD